MNIHPVVRLSAILPLYPVIGNVRISVLYRRKDLSSCLITNIDQPSSETLWENNTCQITRLLRKKRYVHLWAAWLSQPLLLSHKLAWNLLESLNDWNSTYDAPASGTDVIYTDFQKAFDQVSSRRLLYKLSLYGIRGKVLRWLSTFLIGWKQRVVLEGTPSPWCAVTSGVPQGTILGLIMFLFSSTTYLKRFQQMWSCSRTTVNSTAESVTAMTAQHSRMNWTP